MRGEGVRLRMGEMREAGFLAALLGPLDALAAAGPAWNSVRLWD